MKSGRNFWTDRKRIFNRILAVFMVSFFIVEGIAPVSAGADENFELSTKIIYKWQRMTYGDIASMSKGDECRVAIITGRGDSLLDTGRCDMSSFPLACKKLPNDKEYPGITSGPDTLYTAQDFKLVKMKRMENDSDNDNHPMIRLQMENNNQWLSVMKYPEKDDTLHLNYRFGYTDNPRVEKNPVTIVSNMTVWKGCADKSIKLQCNFHWGYSDEYIWANDNGALFSHSNSTDKENKDINITYDFFDKNNYQSDLKFYKVTEERWSCLARNYNVASGQTLRINGKVYVAKGVTLTVEEDAVLLLDGTVMYDGDIKNKGTTVLQKGAVLQSLTSSTSLGSFTCDGGDLLVMRDAKLLCKQGFVLNPGGTCINFGIILVPENFSMNNSCFENRSGGTLILGYDIYPSSFESGSLNNYYHYSNSWQIGTISKGILEERLYNKKTKQYDHLERWNLYGKIPSINIMGNSKLINQGVVKRCARINKASDAVYEAKDSGKELNYDDYIAKLENFYDTYSRGQWYWDSKGYIKGSVY